MIKDIERIEQGELLNSTTENNTKLISSSKIANSQVYFQFFGLNLLLSIEYLMSIIEQNG